MAQLQADLQFTGAVQPNGTNENIAYIRYSVADDAHEEGGQQSLLIGIGAVGDNLFLGGLTTAAKVLVKSDQTLTFYVNGSVDGIQGKALVVDGGAVTALTCDNNSGVVAKVQVVMAGA